MGSRTRAGTWIVAGLIGGLLLLTGALALHYRNLYTDLAEARSLLQEAQDVLEENRLNADEEDLARSEQDLLRAGQLFESARQRLDRDPFVRAAGFVPLLSNQIDAGREMVSIGREATLAGRLAVEAARDFDDVRADEEGTLLEKSVVVLDRIAPEMQTLRAQLDVIDALRARIDEDGLVSPLADAVRELDEQRERVQDLLDDYARARVLAPPALGFHGPRTYLVLAQNNAELLPTGGLISVYGVITLDEGRIEQMEFEDAVAFSDRWMQAGNFIEPPGPLANYLLKGWSWNLALANWSPDFPTSARQAELFLEAGGGPQVDGVIAINVTTLEKLLGVIGSVEVPEYGVTVTEENALDVIEAHTRTPASPGDDRKEIVALLADEVLRRVLQAKPSQWSPLLDTFNELAESKDLLVYLNRPEEQRLVAELGWDGAIRDAPGDYLMVVDASVNSTKLNIAIEQSLDLDVELDELGNARHRLTVSYENQLPAWREGRDPELVSRLMLGGNYGGYVRVLTPAGARFLTAGDGDRSLSLEEISEEQQKTVFGRFFALPSGQRKSLSLEYLSTAVVDGTSETWEYRLLVQKQPGAIVMPLSVSIAAPPGGTLRAVAVDGEHRDPDEPLMLALEKDTEIAFRFDMEPAG